MQAKIISTKNLDKCIVEITTMTGAVHTYTLPYSQAIGFVDFINKQRQYNG